MKKINDYFSKKFKQGIKSQNIENTDKTIEDLNSNFQNLIEQHGLMQLWNQFIDELILKSNMSKCMIVQMSNVEMLLIFLEASLS